MPSRGCLSAWLLSLTALLLLSHLPDNVGALRTQLQRDDILKVMKSHEERSPSDGALPPMHFKFTSFVTPQPNEAAAFCVKYFGGQLLSRPAEFLTHRHLPSEAEVAGVRFFYTKPPSYSEAAPPGHLVNSTASAPPQRRRSFDIYFVNDPTKPTSDTISIPGFNQYLHDTHRFDLQENWDWYQDWHFCLWAEDVDLVLYRLLQDGVPLVTRSSSFYVEIPTGITFQVLGPHLELVWTELFEFCRETDGKSGKQPSIQIGTIPDQLPPIPELAPSHISFFSSQAEAARDFLTSFTSGTAFDMTRAWKLTHRYSDGRCAMLGWIDFPEFQVHFVEQYRKWEGEGMGVRDVEAGLTALHGDMTRKDAFFDNHPAFEVDDLAPFAAALNEQSVPHLFETENGVDSLFFQVPGGVIFHLISADRKSVV